MLQLDRNTAQDVGCVRHTCLLCYGHACVSLLSPQSAQTRNERFVTQAAQLGVEQANDE